MLTAPARTMRIEQTVAKMGRSMKNRTFMAKPSLAHSVGCTAGMPSGLDAGHHHPLSRVHAFINGAQVVLDGPEVTARWCAMGCGPSSTTKTKG